MREVLVQLGVDDKVILIFGIAVNIGRGAVLGDCAQLDA